MFKWLRQKKLARLYQEGSKRIPAFLGHAWGDDIKTVVLQGRDGDDNSFSIVSEKDGLLAIERKEEVSSFGWVNVKRIVYYFWESKLVEIKVVFDDDVYKIREMLEEAYGPSLLNTWRRNITFIQLHENDRVHKHPYLIVSSLYFKEKYNAWRQGQAREAAIFLAG